MAFVPTWLGPFGLLPLVIPVVVVIGAKLGAKLASDGGPVERAMVGMLATLVLLTEGMRIAVGIGWLTPVTPLVLLALGGLLARKAPPLRGGVATWRDALPALAVALLAILVAAVTAYFLPIWQWDSLGYHLPFVNYVIQGKGLGGVPDDVPYLATYPHGIEYLFIAMRLLLPDDRLIDLGQIPFGLVGVVAVTAVARRAGAEAAAALATGAAWICMPGVLLQLPTNYVDVAAAAYFVVAVYFLTGESTARNQVLAGLALGLFLGAKPSAPIPTALAGLVLLWRGRRLISATLAACVAIVVLGAETYLVNMARHGNPIWPIKLALGPIHLPGMYTVQELLSSGAAAPHLTGPTPLRVLGSWLTLVPPPTFDMRMGGFGPVFLCALPLALWALWKKRDGAWTILVVAGLAAPDPAIARYTLGFPSLVLALGASRLPSGIGGASRLAGWSLAALSIFNLAVAFPGFSGEGPPLYRYVQMSGAQRQGATGPDRQTKDLVALRDALPADSAILYDRSFEFAYLLWRSDMANHVGRIPDDSDPEALEAMFSDPRVHVVVVADPAPQAAALAHGFSPLFHCETDTCIVYQRR